MPNCYADGSNDESSVKRKKKMKKRQVALMPSDTEVLDLTHSPSPVKRSRNDLPWEVMLSIKSPTTFASMDNPKPTEKEKRILDQFKSQDPYQYKVNSSTSRKIIQRLNCKEDGCGAQVIVVRENLKLTKKIRPQHNHAPPSADRNRPQSKGRRRHGKKAARAAHAVGAIRPTFPNNKKLAKELLKYAGHLKRQVETENICDNRMFRPSTIRIAARDGVLQVSDKTAEDYGTKRAYSATRTFIERRLTHP